MKALICEMCNSHDLIKEDGLYVCQSCGTKYTVEEAKKLLGTVAVDHTAETEKYLILARRAKEENNSENAAKYYEKVLEDAPANWEASFYQSYYTAMGCKIAEIRSSANTVANSAESAVTLIHKYEEAEKQDEALHEIVVDSAIIATMLASAAVSHKKKFMAKVSLSAGVEMVQECSRNVAASMSIYHVLEDSIKSVFGENHKEVVTVQTLYVTFITEFVEDLNKEVVIGIKDRLEKEIQNKNPTYKPQEVKSGGCYVATAVYGSYDCPQVWTLRRFRDDTLATTWYGRLFIHTYYAISPTMVKWFGKTEWFKKIFKPRLDKLVMRLNSDGVDNTPYNDKVW